MNPEKKIEQVVLNLQSGNRKEAKNLLRQIVDVSPDNLKAGLFLVKLELDDKCLAAAMEILSVLWKKTRHAAVGDLMADLGSAVIRDAAQMQQADRKVIERIAGLIKAVQGSKNILVDILGYDSIGGLGVDAIRLVSVYKTGLTQRTGKTVVFFSGKSANPAMVKILSRELPVFCDPDFPAAMPYTTYDWDKGCYILGEKFSKDFFGRHGDLFKDTVDITYSTNGKSYCLSKEEYAATQPFPFQFSESEKEKGEHFLRNIMRLPQDAWFVCLYARDGAYYNETPQSPNWFRNSDIRTYIPAIDEILARGGYVIRVGVKTDQKLNHPNPHFIDYSNSEYRDPLLDIYLLAKCRFFLGTHSGLIYIPFLFNIPQVHVNAINGFSWNCDIWIPKKIIDTRTNQLLPYPEFYKRYYGYGNMGLFAENGVNQEKLLHVRYIDNSPDEIASAAVEMMNRLDGAHVEAAMVKNVREKFVPVLNKWKIAIENHTVASCFIESHPELFETAQESGNAVMQNVFVQNGF